MGRVIHTESPRKDRNRLLRTILLATKELLKYTELNPETRDLAAFIVIALKSIFDSIDETVVAWEKRGFWVKADRFRLEWAWTDVYSQRMKKGLDGGNWLNVEETAKQILMKLSHIKITEQRRHETPWKGAWSKYTGSNPGIEK